jgi:hypothetical protein
MPSQALAGHRLSGKAAVLAISSAREPSNVPSGFRFHGLAGGTRACVLPIMQSAAQAKDELTIPSG